MNRHQKLGPEEPLVAVVQTNRDDDWRWLALGRQFHSPVVQIGSARLDLGQMRRVMAGTLREQSGATAVRNRFRQGVDGLSIRRLSIGVRLAFLHVPAPIDGHRTQSTQDPAQPRPLE